MAAQLLKRGWEGLEGGFTMTAVLCQWLALLSNACCETQTCTLLQAQLVKIQEHQAHIEQQLDGVKSHLLELEQQEGFTELD